MDDQISRAAVLQLLRQLLEEVDEIEVSCGETLSAEEALLLAFDKITTLDLTEPVSTRSAASAGL